jgi:hypothetical protein
LSISDNIRRNVKKEESKSSEEKLRDTFNNASLKLIDTFMQDVSTGAVKVDSVTDLSRLFQIYTDINNINSLSGEGTGTLPALSPGERNVISDYLPTEIVNDGEEDKELVDLADLASLTDKEVHAMLTEKEKVMNQQNEGTF